MVQSSNLNHISASRRAHDARASARAENSKREAQRRAVLNFEWEKISKLSKSLVSLGLSVCVCAIRVPRGPGFMKVCEIRADRNAAKASLHSHPRSK